MLSDFSSFSKTDLASERFHANTSIRGVSYSEETTLAGVWERINISSQEGAKSIGRPMGIYNTLNVGRMELLDEERISDVKKELSKELKKLINEMCVLPRRLLIVGFGNPVLTADSLGFEAAKKVRPTLHIKTMDESFFSTLNCSELAVIAPGVPSMTGLESIITVSGICNKIKPNAVIAIDAIAARSTERLGSTIQISTTGIIPGSGLGNHNSAINEENTGAPVLSIGVPTVISADEFCREINPKNQEKHKSHKMFVSPKEIDEIILVAARIIGESINQAFGLY